MDKHANDMVEVELPIFCSAARVAFLAGDNKTYRAAFEILSRRARMMAKKNPLVKAFLNKCDTPEDDDVIPFALDPFTSICAACFFPENPLGDFIIYSDYSKIEAGYLVCKSTEMLYVDRMLVDKKDLELAVFPKYSMTPEMLNRFAAIDLTPPELSFQANSGNTLELRLSKDVGDLFSEKQSSSTLTILRVGARGKTSRRTLSNVKVSKINSNNLSITLNGEQQLEVHAAFFNDSWLCIEGDDQSIVCKIPSLDPEATPERAWLASTSYRFNKNKHPYTPIQAPYLYISQLLAKHHWFSCVKVDEWFHIASSVARKMGKAEI